MFGDDEDHFDSASMYPLLYNASALDDRLSNLADVSVMKLANEDVVSVNVDDDVSDFFKVIADNRIKKVPVLDNGKMVGVASKSDLFREMMKKSSYIGENKDSM
jgi:predicted transcriptional regulator